MIEHRLANEWVIYDNSLPEHKRVPFCVTDEAIARQYSYLPHYDVRPRHVTNL